ncbi:TonB-dependent receptor domain-containing protein [Limnohabitans sp.]|uniref:TonB-dependent receptor n=1 Tax=Limnohabitans sp. TaxID=1907725 RepID=UPI00286F8D93|nr:TonB-dependent receptor [Limnohabitans sp.]
MKHIFQRSAVAAAVYTLLGASWGSVWAQTAGVDDVHHLDEVTITARSLDRADLMVPAQQLSGAALTQRQGSTLGETLDNLPGIANGSFGPNVGRPIIRGMDGDRIRILQNSGSNMDVSGLSNDHAVPIDPLTTERIDVVRGPATLLYGGSAIGGVVNVIDNRIAHERTFDAQGGVMGKVEVHAGGAADERSTGAMVEAGNDKFVLHVDAFERSTQKLRVSKEMACGDGGASHALRVCNSASESKGGAVGGTLLFDRGYLGLSTSEYRSTYGTVAAPTVHIGILRRHHVMEGQLREVGVFQDLKVQLGHTRYTHTEFETPQATDGTRFDNKGHDFRLQGRQHAVTLGSGMQLEGVVGMQNERSNVQVRSDGQSVLLPPSQTQSTGVFTYQAVTTSWGQLSAGARAEHVTVQSFEDREANAAQSQKFKPISFALGAMRNLRQGEAQNGWQHTTHLSTSQRAPKDYELFAHGVHAASATYEIGQPTNGIEKGTQLDMGSAWKQGAHKWGITGFASHFSNYLALRATGVQFDPNGENLPEYRFEGVRARFYGIESTATIRMVSGQDAVLTPTAAHGAMDLELRADVVRAQDLTHSSPMPRIAPMRVGADAVWSRHALGARFGFMHAAAQNRVPQNGAEPGITTAGHTLWNAGLNYHTHRGPTHWLLFAKLDNITNKLAYSPTSVLTQTLRENAPPLAGRSLKVGAQVSF